MACCAASRDNLIRVQDLPNTCMENAKFVKDHKEINQVKNRPFWIKKDIFEQPRINNFFFKIRGVACVNYQYFHK